MAYTALAQRHAVKLVELPHLYSTPSLHFRPTSGPASSVAGIKVNLW